MKQLIKVPRETFCDEKLGITGDKSVDRWIKDNRLCKIWLTVVNKRRKGTKIRFTWYFQLIF